MITFINYFDIKYTTEKVDGKTVVTEEKKSKEIPIIFDLGTIKRWCMETGMKQSDIVLAEDDIELLETLFWHSTQRAYNQLGQKNPNKREDMENILSNIDGEGFLAAIQEAQNVPEEFLPKEGEIKKK